MKFKIDFLDHVAINVRDLDASVAWYDKVLGLKEYRLPRWGLFPVFMLAGTSGVAIFPARKEDAAVDATSRNVKIDHFAFNVTPVAFEQAMEHYRSLDLEFTFQDHHYFHSLYTKDPDGHTVELTTLVVDPADFYHYEDNP